jgi:transcriptional regulator with XRE-family HTH domain
MSIGERIKQLREVLGLTQTEFASKIGLSYKMLGLYELKQGQDAPAEGLRSDGGGGTSDHQT